VQHDLVPVVDERFCGASAKSVGGTGDEDAHRAILCSPDAREK
jgi:hypothetical protein